MRTDTVYLHHILDCIQAIEQYTRDEKDVFMSSRLVQDAVIRNLEVIGEATKRVSSELKTKNPHIPWREMAGMRDVLIHDYLGVDLAIVWNVVHRELPSVKEMIRQTLEQTN